GLPPQTTQEASGGTAIARCTGCQGVRAMPACARHRWCRLPRSQRRNRLGIGGPRTVREGQAQGRLQGNLRPRSRPWRGGGWPPALVSPCAQGTFPPVPPTLRGRLRLSKCGRGERVRRRTREIHLHFHGGPTVLGKRLARGHPILARAKLHEARGREEHPSR